MSVSGAAVLLGIKHHCFKACFYIWCRLAHDPIRLTGAQLSSDLVSGKVL